MKRGLSNIVITVLIVLVALVAIGIVWGFLAPIFKQGSESAYAKSSCVEVNVEPQRCLIKPDNTTSVVVGVVKGNVEGFVVTVEYSDAKTKSKNYEGEMVSTHETRVVEFENVSANVFAVAARAAVFVKTKSGEKIVCDESGVVIACGRGIGNEGTGRCRNDADCPVNHVCRDGVCTTFVPGKECYKDSDCPSGYKCNNLGYCYREGTNPGTGPGSPGGECEDGDKDGYGKCPKCGKGNGCKNDGNDCDDNDPNVFPGAVEEKSEPATCFDQKDNDCDAVIDLLDSGCQPNCYTVSGECKLTCALGSWNENGEWHCKYLNAHNRCCVAQSGGPGGGT